ncbi:hypothetical protein GCM10025864_08420 [Luteimicrobium album]|uniref:EamA domain-containing protein n=1 Tax=Luteimicrobium album TaxID=1054550 RepID=A0ABQ6HX43_9MICO|nr:hypothetical protein [Luteimicrobium album]GMA23083.1 hypothetical protein GCM10025864_08420 [Luteimicrobium album]
MTSGAVAMVFVGGSAAVSHVLVDAPLFTAQALRYAAAAVVLLLVARVRGSGSSGPGASNGSG